MEFLWARALRIYPALVVMVLLTVFGLGLFFTNLPLASYFSKLETYRYLLKNTTLVTGVTYSLPGVFETVPAKGAINGSLWTMPFEIWMYLTLACAWLLSKLVSNAGLRAFKFSIA